jgi:hypothetical protein
MPQVLLHWRVFNRIVLNAVIAGSMLVSFSCRGFGQVAATDLADNKPPGRPAHDIAYPSPASKEVTAGAVLAQPAGTSSGPSVGAPFATASSAILPVTFSVEVHAKEGGSDLSTSTPFVAGGEDVLNSAGSHGDLLRFLQLSPGVVSTSDLSNQMLVRGGHPMENLYLLDGIEVPNINHLANSNTTGGFGPMIDAAAVQSLTLQTGGFEARYPERLSSITEFRTLDSKPSGHAEGEFGIQGLGFLLDLPVRRGDLLASAHHGLLDVVASDTGMNGVPSYTNALTRFRRKTGDSGEVTLVNVVGWDSISITPCAGNKLESNAINSQYSGWRETTGIRWQSLGSAKSVSAFSLSDSEQVEHISQQDQQAQSMHARINHPCPIPADMVKTIPVYEEDSNNSFTTAKYDWQREDSKITSEAGSSLWLQRPHFDVDQPNGVASPYSSDPSRTDYTAFHSDFSTGESGTYAQIAVRPAKAVSIGIGARLQTFAFGNHVTVTPRFNARYHFSEAASVHVSYATYAQLPPYAVLVAYPENRSLAPIRAAHQVAGLNFTIKGASRFVVEAYRKQYHDVPASSEYPSVTMHTQVDMIGEQLVWLPMNSQGFGSASGVELSNATRWRSRLTVQSSLAYSRAKFAGTDKILRASNFDLPWIFNVAAIARFSRGWTVAGRYAYATGHPYTPFNLPLSTAQNRPIYDLSLQNMPRAPYYARLDSQLVKDIRVHGFHLQTYLGVDNIMNRSNFLSYVWFPRVRKGQNQVGTAWQMPIFPNFGVRFVFR